VATVNLYEYVGGRVTGALDPLGLELVPVKDSSGNIVGYIDTSLTNCLGYACRAGGSLNPAFDRNTRMATSSLGQLLGALDYDCTANISAKDCPKRCKCQDYIELYVYIRRQFDERAVRVKYKGRDPLKDPILGLETELDFHALRGEQNGEYTYQPAGTSNGVAIQKANENPHPYPNRHDPWPDYFSTDQILEKYCCCKKDPDPTGGDQYVKTKPSPESRPNPPPARPARPATRPPTHVAADDEDE